MRKHLLLVFYLVMGLSIQGSSQLLQGRVLNESGGLASNVTVNFQNKANSISTGEDGKFRIMATKLPDTLVFSAVGYEPYKVVITEKNIKDVNFEVVLLNKRAMMDEVVVTAMASRREAKELGYSVSSPREERLSGKVAGLYVGGDRDKSTIRIRGAASSSPVNHADTRFYFKDSIGPRDGMLAKSRVVTAGEVNDFNKWKMWEDYSAAEFKTQTKFWNIYTSHRFSVQVTDKKHNGIINEPVFLIDKNSNDTVWKAYTDNTGKAELWASLFDSTGKSNYFISTKNENRINTPVEFANGVNHIQLDKPCQVSQDVDIAFVVDATGSMGDEIEFLKLELEDVIRSTMEKYQSLSLRAASVFYRDKGDEYVTKHIPFHDDLLKTLNFIKLQQAGGGGDHPEAVADALTAALDSLQWNESSRARLLFLVLDAPPHTSERQRMETLIGKAAAMGIRVIPIACSGTDKSTEFLLRSMALATNGTYAFLTDHSGVGNKHIEPTTDKYSVELLNTLMQRIIAQFLYAKPCDEIVTTASPDIDVPENLSSIKLYPNPTSGRFTIETKKQIKEIYVTDFSGKILMRLSDPGGHSKKEKWNVDISSYASGTYLVKYITADNKWGGLKVILIH